jgi:hypothetical protein
MVIERRACHHRGHQANVANLATQHLAVGPELSSYAGFDRAPFRPERSDRRQPFAPLFVAH